MDSRAAPRLHLGCGPVRLAGWINVDRVATAATDVVADLAIH